MKRIQVMVDDSLAFAISRNADERGLSISAIARLALKKAFVPKKKKLRGIDRAFDDLKNGRVQKLTSEEFDKQLDKLIG